jgi:hypothetical protein
MVSLLSDRMGAVEVSTADGVSRLNAGGRHPFGMKKQSLPFTQTGRDFALIVAVLAQGCSGGRWLRHDLSVLTN